MNKTEKIHWKNGLDRRGKDFYTLAGSVKKYAFLLCFCWSHKTLNIEFFKLI